MCGIAGFVDKPRPASEEIIRAQLSCQRHRGPDAEGAFVRGRGAIAQNRLAIIDLEHGDPPITNEDGTIGVVLNGEIYNFRELRRQLESEGHRFATGCDTEVIAHLAEQCDAGRAGRSPRRHVRVRRLGRRARAADPRARPVRQEAALLLDVGGARSCSRARSRGSSPIPTFPASSTRGAIPAYLTFGYVPTPRTFFAGVRSLPPGHVLTLERRRSTSVGALLDAGAP